MTATTGIPAEVEAYLAAVGATLADLAPEEREDLLEDVQASLLELAAEGEGGPLAARLGPPEAFAAELRASAGLAPAPAPALASQGFALHLQAAWESSPVRAVRRLCTDLAPIWWLARACIAVGALALAMNADWSFAYRVIPRFGSATESLVVLGLAIVASIALGIATRNRGTGLRIVSIVVNIALLVLAVPVFGHLIDIGSIRQDPAPVQVIEAPPTLGLAYDGVPIQNVYPYDRDGNLLQDVLLYGGDGMPLAIGGPDRFDPDRRVLFTDGKEPLYNSFPIRYTEPGTDVVARPELAPGIVVPSILTPPLDLATSTGAGPLSQP